MLNFASISLLLALALGPSGMLFREGQNNYNTSGQVVAPEDATRVIYTGAGLEGKLDYDIFQRALEGMKAFNAPNPDILTIIDYTRPSGEERFFVIDLANRRLLVQTLVAHGKNSGEREATHFSNRPRSLQSSPGFYLTAETYNGQHGYSLRLDGLESGINDLARDRAIVIHGADYVCQEYVKEYGYIGRSWGCPALPLEMNRKVIDLIKEGSCLYIHTDNPAYAKSTALKGSTEQTVQLF